ncbi:PAS domain-containing sensor histidine kinase [Falsochrobactrum sp. TDYN1]|uniref:histidine kinase n=1 Tax=Falsochrobactrum tianjinense TaxID=2706015 RepID=A0A949PS92_9HYPH|nr:PAS domain-containing sensor histidine kinase [Falsochrobactrum sp. TDYN1]MBV2145076.1 PAS domain-containing sensor histidine kinase [Falsochrobactrum sp. TDYN1]
MSRRARALLGVALPVLAIIMFIVLLAFSLMRLSNIERDMRIEGTQNMLWVISRAHISSLQLGEAVAGSVAGEVDPAQMELRYNVFLSRLALLDDGPQRRRMEALGATFTLDTLRGSLPELGSLLMNAGPEVVPRIKALLLPYNNALTEAANMAMVAEWDDLGATLDATRKQLWQIIISMIGISLAGTVLCIHFLLAIRDARQRTRLLNKEKAFSELLIGSSGEGIVAVDMDRRCTVWNEAAERLFGLAADGATGTMLSELSGFFEVDKIDQAIGDALQGQAVALLDQPFFPSHQSEPLYVDLRCFSLRDGGRIMGAILLVSDVTERRAAQREIANHRDHLEQMVQARTQELDAALTRERTTAELYRNFGTMISHQFRTPLALVDSALQRLMRRRDRLTPAEVLKRGEEARGAITRLVRLVESTLDAARLDAGQIEVRSQVCDLGILVAEICSRLTEDTGSGRITVTLPDGGSPIAYCDPVHAENILTNLLSNAAKYSPAETPITITLAENGTQIECVVANVGTQEESFENDALFERYYRGSNTEGRPGIGVGLYMARAFARLQGGDVQLQRSDAGVVRLAMLLPRSTSDSSSVATMELRKESA